MNLAETAVALARRGMSVFPLMPRQKRPLFDWKEFATKQADPARVGYWWNQWPDCNIGLATGVVSGLFVLDCDSDDAVKDALQRGVTGLSDPAGALTANGAHFYFKMPDFPVGNRAGILPGMDIRGTGGYVVAPPSVHPSGVRYCWQHGAIISAPAWLLKMLRPKPRPDRPTYAPRVGIQSSGYARRALDRELDKLAMTQSGARGQTGRNDQLNRSAFSLGQLIGDNLLDRAEVENALYNVAIIIGLGENETRKTIASGMNAGIANPRSARGR